MSELMALLDWFGLACRKSGGGGKRQARRLTDFSPMNFSVFMRFATMREERMEPYSAKGAAHVPVIAMLL